MDLKDALVVVDLQNGVMNFEEGLPDSEKIIEYAEERINEYSNAGKPVFIVRHNDEGLKKGTKDWETVPEISEYRDLIYIDKKHPNAFYETDLKELLDKHKVKSFEILGAETGYCMDATIKFGHGLGYDIFMKKGMHTTSDIGYLSQEDTRKMFEEIWNGRFLTLE